MYSGRDLTNLEGRLLYNREEKRADMVYEVYVDSLFVVNFVMNLYLLSLVRLHFPGTATPGRVICGAIAGAGSYVAGFFLPEWGIAKWVLTWLLGTVTMLFVTFGLQRLKSFVRLLLVLTGYSFLMGGLLLFLKNSFPFLREKINHVPGVLITGAILFLLLRVFIKKEKRYTQNCNGKATLIAENAKLVVAVLVDSGNSLVEPISGKPVCIIDARMFRALWGIKTIPYRAIPYCSIGKARGILKGYLLPEMKLEWNGVEVTCRDVFVAVSPEECGKMIINPDLLEKERNCS